MKYLDPKADLTFKKVFGENKDLVISFLNALLPLPEDAPIEEVEYLDPEMIPENPWRKYSIVDVRCRDSRGRQFLVEMQMLWSPEFKQRVLFNASKAYVRQAEKGDQYKLIQPVYSLNLVNEVFEPDIEEYYHYYRMVHEQHTDRVIDGLHLVFIELPKFQPHNFSEKRMQVLWLRFLTEIDDKTIEAAPELLQDPLIGKAIKEVETGAYTPAQMEGYDKFWDIISVEKCLLGSAEERGMKRGMAIGMEQGMEKGMEKAKMLYVRKMLQKGLDPETIMELTGLTNEEVEKIKGLM